MLNSFYQFLMGYIKFSFTNGFCEKFLNDCRKNDISLRNIKIKNNILIAEVSVKNYFYLHKIARKYNGKVQIIEKRGVPFLFSPLKNRFGLLFGVIFFMCFISSMGGCIWNINVICENKNIGVEVVDFLNKSGVKIGTRWNSFDKENMEFSVLSNFEDVSWIAINKFGSTAQIELNETIKTPNIKDNKTITNVKATKDGIIENVTALSGYPSVKKGEAVTKGDLLISGVYDNEIDEKTYYTHANGTVIAKCEEKINLNISRQQVKKIYKNTKKYKTIYFFGLKIPLYIFKDNSMSEKSVKETYWSLNSKRIPVGIIEENYKYFKVSSYTLTDDELEKLCKSELLKEKNEMFKNCKILKENEKFKMNENSCEVNCVYEVLEDIAQESEILIDKDYFNDEKMDNKKVQE